MFQSCLICLRQNDWPLEADTSVDADADDADAVAANSVADAANTVAADAMTVILQ